jgi:hypothetical protein
VLSDTIRTILDTRIHEASERHPSRHTQGVVFALFLILASLYTYPLVTSLSTHIPGAPGIVDEKSDASLQTWYPWWVRKALTSGEPVLHSDWVFHPLGMEMTMQPAMFLHGAMTVPLLPLDITTANNIVILVSFALSGLAAFLLTFYLTGSMPASLLSGFIYALCPYKFQHIEGHYHLMATETLPLVALSLIRLCDRPTNRHLAWAGVWLGVTVYTDYYYFAYSLLLFGLITIYKTVTANDPIRTIRQILLAGCIAFIVASPLLIPALLSATSSDYSLASGHSKFKADILSPFIPSARQWISGPIQPLIEWIVDTKAVDGVEHSIYAGWAILILCAAFSWKLWSAGGDARLFIIGGFTFFVFALGPELSINGHATFGESEWQIPMPSWVLTQLPLVKGARAPSRIVIVGMLCLAVVTGYALSVLLTRGTWLRIRKEIWVGAILLVTGLEYIIPIHLSEMPNMDLWKVVKIDEEPGILVHVPLSFNRSAFTQPYHQRKLLTVNLGRTDTDVSQYYWRHEALQYLSLPHWTTHLPTEEEASYLIDLLGIRYVDLDRTPYSADKVEHIRTGFKNTYGMTEVYTSDTNHLFRVDRPFRKLTGLYFEASDRQADLHLAYGWSNREAYGEHSITWIIRKKAAILSPPVLDGAYRLEISILAKIGGEQEVSVTCNDQSLGDFPVYPGLNTLSISVPKGVLSQESTNVLTLQPDLDLGRPYTSGHHLDQAYPTPIEVTSGGYFTPGYGSVSIKTDGAILDFHKRGWLFAVIDPVTGVIGETKHFEGLDTSNTVEKVTTYINQLPVKTPIVIAKRTVAYVLGGNLGKALESFGFDPGMDPNPFDSFAAIVERNGRPPVYSEGTALASIAVGRQPVTKDGSIGLISLKLTAQ